MTCSLHPPRRTTLSALVEASLISLFAASFAQAATCTVNLNTDDPGDGSTTGASATVTAATVSGTLRDCIVAANLMTGSTGAPTTPGMAITFDPAVFTGGSNNLITLGSTLPLLFNNTSLDASALSAPVTIDGGGTHRIFFVSGLPDSSVAPLPDPDGAQAITVSLNHLILQNGNATGGSGHSGGMGAGAALFVNKAASVVLTNISFDGNTAHGADNYDLGRGGGGMGPTPTGLSGNGGNGFATLGFSANGGGIGTDSTSTTGGHFGGAGIGQISNAQGFGTGFGGGSGSQAGNGGSGGVGGGGGYGTFVSGNYNTGGGGHGGFGGGGGFGGENKGGDGGFGAGGGMGLYGNGGFGGFGGGGGYGAGPFGIGGFGGFGGGGGAGGFFGGLGGIGAGHGGISSHFVAGNGGGGAGFGGAVFVRSGGSISVHVDGSASISGGGAVAGIGASNGAAAGSGLFLMSGATTTFDIAGVLTLSDNIADDSASSLPGTSPASYTPGDGAGASITKIGNGTLVVSGANTSAGATAVNAGTLAGTGIVVGPVTLASGAQIAPGDPNVLGGVGTFNTGPLTWTSGGAMVFQLGATAAGSDLLIVDGELSKGGSGGPYTFHFGMGNLPPVAGTTYTLIQSDNAATFAAGDFSFDADATYKSLSGHFAIIYNVVQFTVDAVTMDRIFANGFD